ncbi:MAG: preprotein translocase subunit SecG [Bacteroidota bacterium]|nr:preprotein translocase subunit SecG [Bacteroidota bacterium]
MLFLFGTIIIIASVILGIIILIQNPKGGGLSSSLGGFGNQLMGVRQTTDILEKGTWLFAGIIGLLCITSALFIPKTGGTNSRDNLINNAPVGNPTPQPNNTAPLQTTPQTLPPAPATQK